ncbi:glycosyltransferase family 4 protein [Listeria booriae]|uniref:Glycosyltransferase family 4 protein n=1 Tax=Listeria booriae TaxID=1552123 RepID=A0A7X1D6X1_9LIST|nr:glycosyltransferase [Listeria booriae]MBC2174997.1 glycosyltransferase family 4 protein [Listeria booriae]
MKKRVTMFVWNEFQNDAHVLRECTALAEAGYELQLLALGQEKTSAEERANQFTIRRLGFKPLILPKQWHQIMLLFLLFVTIFYIPLLAISLIGTYFVLYKTKLKYVIRDITLAIKMIYWGIKADATVYHANDLKTLFQAVVCGKWIRKRKVIFDSHEVDISHTHDDSVMYPLVESFLMRYTDACIYENDTRARLIEKLYHFFPNVVYNYPCLPTHMDVINLHDTLHLPEDELILLYQGSLQEGRGLDILLDAIPHIKRGTIVFAGEGPMKPVLIEETMRRKLSHRVRFLPEVAAEQRLAYTSNAYMGFQLLHDTYFTHYSATPNELFEYIMAGVPIVACDFPEIRKVLKNDEIGVIVQPDNAHAIAKAVNIFIDQPELREKMHQNTFQAREKYNWTNEKIKFLKIYQRLIEV